MFDIKREVDMLKKNVLFICVCAGCIVFFASCKSSPESEPAPGVTAPTEVVDQEEPHTQPDARTYAVNQDILLFYDIENDRQAALDAGAETYFPEDLEWYDAVLDDIKIEAEQEPGNDAVFAIGNFIAEGYRSLEADSKAEAVKPERNAALEAKQRADSVQPVETKEVPFDEVAAYEEAVASLLQGEGNLDSGDIETALSDYQSARETFDDVFVYLSEKQDKAAEAARQAEAQRQAEIQRQAQIEAALKQAVDAARRAEAAAKQAEAARSQAEERLQAADAARKQAEDRLKQAEEQAQAAEAQRQAEELARQQAEADRQAEELARQQAEAARKLYTVQTGDTYTSIAGDVYHDPTLWSKIYEANREKMTDPDNPHLIYPNLVIEIPVTDGE
jgi:nucleoid-associated protein YgaU